MNYLQKFEFLWISFFTDSDISDWYTLIGGLLSGLIAGAITFIGVKVSINHNEKKEQIRNLPKLEVLDHQLHLNMGQLRNAREPIVFNIQNFGGTIAKNIEAEISFNHLEELVENAKKVFKEKIEGYGPEVESRIFSMGQVDNRGAYLLMKNVTADDKLIDNHYGVLNEKYHRLLGNCVSINLNYEAEAELVLPKDIHGWMSYFYGYGRKVVFEQGLFDMTLKLKYLSLDNKKYEKKFNLSFKDKGIEEIEGKGHFYLVHVKAKETK